jgi:hypothetical protein
MILELGKSLPSGETEISRLQAAEISERANLMNQKLNAVLRKLKAKLLGPPLCPYRLKPFRAVSPSRGETKKSK